MHDAIEAANAENAARQELAEADAEEQRLRAQLHEAIERKETAYAEFDAVSKVAEAAISGFFENDAGVELVDPGFTVIGPKEKILPRLGAETIEHIKAVGQAMSEKYGLQPDQVGVLRTPKQYARYNSPSMLVVADISDKGIMMGSYDQITNPENPDHNPDNFTLQVGDKTYDTRMGMTRTAYETLWYFGEPKAHHFGDSDAEKMDRIARWHRHFDATDADSRDGLTHNATLLTGEPVENSSAFYGKNYISGERPELIPCWIHGAENTRSMIRDRLLFRPAVIIE